MNWLRSTTFCASVPSQTDAAMNNASAAIAPIPGDGADRSAIVWATNSSPSSMVRLRLFGAACRQPLLRLLLAQVLVRDHKIRKHKAQPRAHGPRQHDSPENPIGKADHVGQRRHIAAVSQPIAHADRI